MVMKYFIILALLLFFASCSNKTVEPDGTVVYTAYDNLAHHALIYTVPQKDSATYLYQGLILRKDTHYYGLPPKDTSDSFGKRVHAPSQFCY
jgi:hypothetical protein